MKAGILTLSNPRVRSQIPHLQALPLHPPLSVNRSELRGTDSGLGHSEGVLFLRRFLFMPACRGRASPAAQRRCAEVEGPSAKQTRGGKMVHAHYGRKGRLRNEPVGSLRRGRGGEGWGGWLFLFCKGGRAGATRRRREGAEEGGGGGGGSGVSHSRVLFPAGQKGAGFTLLPLSWPGRGAAPGMGGFTGGRFRCKPA